MKVMAFGKILIIHHGKTRKQSYTLRHVYLQIRATYETNLYSVKSFGGLYM
jgi:hypothetical protein